MQPEPEKSPESSDATLDLGNRLFDFLDSRKAVAPLLLDLTEVNPYFRTFLIATASSQVHLKSLVRETLREFHTEVPQTGTRARPDEADSGWVIIDFIDVVVHLFTEDMRSFYNLERLWGDGQIVRGEPAGKTRQP